MNRRSPGLHLEAKQIAARITAGKVTAADFDRLQALGPEAHVIVHEYIDAAHEEGSNLDSSTIRALAASIEKLAEVLARPKEKTGIVDTPSGRLMMKILETRR